MSSDGTFGTILTGPLERDAIHVATASVVAAERLRPGSDIGFVNAGDIHLVGGPTMAKKTIGIVDPYLKRPVITGQWFWMLLYPRTITSLHHNWTHPDFVAIDPPVNLEGDILGSISAMRDGVRLPPILPDASYVEAVQWVEDFANRNDSDYDQIMEAADGYVKYKDYLCQGGRWEGCHVPDEFRDKYETIMKEKISEKNRGSFFSCSC